eukprot:CAMPEP_0185761632 /NCGR_PEP_ID=MMETSP1174-20130828/20578_1 /TAXON_ID=35687 /ORGANISM="Dictyocha speculum, Strain CCMP1381" /LENGTH=263 /DNA_ID=CAMNT_0028442957 /DNA_START=31 /DNA_END=819 /DNA_ORIENTATION=+
MTQEAKRPDSLLKLWIAAVRPNTLAASFTPVLVGASLSYRDGARNFNEALAFWVFALCIQIGTNLHNDYADFVRGADTKERLGQARVTSEGWLTPYEVARGSTIALSLAAIVGVRLIHRGGYSMLWIVVTSIFNAVAYTGGHYPLGYIHPALAQFSIGYSGLGDLFVFVYFGFVAVCGTYYLQLLQLPTYVVWAALPIALLATAIIVVNNLRDRKTDVKANKRTLAVRFGATFARIEYTILVGGGFASLLYITSFVAEFSDNW